MHAQIKYTVCFSKKHSSSCCPKSRSNSLKDTTCYLGVSIRLDLLMPRVAQHVTRKRLFDELDIASATSYSTTVQRVRLGYVTRRGKASDHTATSSSHQHSKLCCRQEVSIRQFWRVIVTFVEVQTLVCFSDHQIGGARLCSTPHLSESCPPNLTLPNADPVPLRSQSSATCSRVASVFLESQILPTRDCGPFQ